MYHDFFHKTTNSMERSFVLFIYSKVCIAKLLTDMVKKLQCEAALLLR